MNSFVKERGQQRWENDPHRKAKLHFKLDLDDDVTVAISREWVRRALDVLIDNAIEAVAERKNKRITVGTRDVPAGKCEVYIADNGVGIPEGIRDKIINDPIEKQDGTKGMGMGLLMAQAIVQTYGGEIILESTGDEGTCMVIQLPLADN